MDAVGADVVVAADAGAGAAGSAVVVDDADPCVGWS